VEPIIALWLPFLAFTALVWWMYRTTAHVPGGQAIGALERASAKGAAALSRWFRFARGRKNPA
jgi:lipopolysaccharide export system permease protein